MNKVKLVFAMMKSKVDNLLYKLSEQQYKRKYPDYNEDYDCRNYHYVWSNNPDGNAHSLNDIEIGYNRKTKLYMLGIETAILFKDKHEECGYLKRLLSDFTGYMSDQHLDTDSQYMLFMTSPEIPMEAETIPELYTAFKIFVLGFCALYDT